MNSTINYFPNRQKHVRHHFSNGIYSKRVSLWYGTFVNFVDFGYDGCLESIYGRWFEASLVTTFTWRSIFSANCWLKLACFWIVANSSTANDAVKKFLCKSRGPYVVLYLWTIFIVKNSNHFWLWDFFVLVFLLQRLHAVRCSCQRLATIHFSIYLPICMCYIALAMAFVQLWERNKRSLFIWVPVVLRVLLAMRIKLYQGSVERLWVL